MHKTLLASIVFCCIASVSAAAQEPFTFAVFGDIQDESAEGHAMDLAMADQIRTAAPDFTVFVGDLQGGGACTDQQRNEAVEVFTRIDGPLIYTPGDNEWADCALPNKGPNPPLERLARLREAFNPPGRSFGVRPITLEQQLGFPENAIWRHGDVIFVTLNVPGSNNALYPNAYAFNEFQARNAANIAWLRGGFARVRSTRAKAMVVLFHGDPNWGEVWWTASAYHDLKEGLAREGAALGVPILAVHGDHHVLTIDKPLAFNDGQTRADHLTRLEVFGPPQRGFVLVSVDTRSLYPFSLRPVEMVKAGGGQ